MIREMYAEIQKQTDKHSVSELCEIYGVSRSGYYKWLKRAGQLNRYEKTHKILDSYVLDIHSHHPMMGYRQIRDKLYLEFGWIVSDPTVWKSMKRLRIHGYTRRRKAAATGTNLEHIRYANVLNRKFKAEKPMQKIATDVTYIKHMAEDNDLNAELATIMLEDAGMTVTRASDGKEVVNLFKNHPRGTYDLILMDIMMPNMDGHQAAKAIRALGIERSDAATIPIIALSANAFIDDIQESLDLGMNAHISKPINMEELIDTITKYKQSIPQSNHSV